MAEKLRTGQVAKAAGVNVETLRFYERRGILKEPERRSSGYREYPPEAVRVVRFIKRAQELGFTLDEIEELLVLRESDRSSCEEAQTAAKQKMEQIQEKIQGLLSMKKALAVLVESCGNKGSIRECPILDALDDKPTKRGRS